MPIEILMPALSPTMTEGNLAKWVKKEGDAVHSGDVLAEIETDKATMEVEAVDDGRVGKILVPEGTQGVKVNQPIALLLGEGEDPSALTTFAASVARPVPAAASGDRRAATGPGSFGSCGGARDQPGPTAMAGFSPAPWPAAWRSRPASTLPRSSARGRRAGSSKPISMPRFRQRGPRPPPRFRRPGRGQPRR